MTIQQVVHLVPYDGIGGVETAARTMRNIQDGNINFRVLYICTNKSREKNLKSTYNPIRWFLSAWSFRRKDVDILIVSLWRSLIVGILVKIFKPKIKLITFLHLENDVHLLDYICHKVSIFLSFQIWADSEATRKGRLSDFLCEQCRVISFVSKNIEALPTKIVSPVFIFWGRITHQKGLDRAIIIFKEIHKNYNNARFIIIGPDGGSLLKIEKLCKSYCLTESVSFNGPSTFDKIIGLASEASFYLQTSISEGMAMSVIESMQLGLVPIVTPVGEINSYCKDGSNAVIIDSDSKAIKDVLRLIDSDSQYQKLRIEAISTWKDKPLYKDSVLDACKQIIENNYLKF